VTWLGVIVNTESLDVFKVIVVLEIARDERVRVYVVDWPSCRIG